MAETALSASRQLSPRIPFGGRLHIPEKLLYEPVIVLVPFYRAKSSQMQRHVQFLLDEGFRVAQFDLSYLEDWKPPKIVSSHIVFGQKGVWSDQVEAVLNSIPGPKIVYAFSNPSASAIEAIARRHATDVLGLICDSGPSGMILNSIAKMLKQENRGGWLPVRWLNALALSIGWSPKFRTAISADLEKIPEGFPILSIRGWKDKIISPYEIDKVFDPHPQIRWKKLSLPMADHLNGLKDFAEEYKPAVLEFLKSCC